MSRVRALAAYGGLGLPLAMAALPVYVQAPAYYAGTLGLPLAKGVSALLKLADYRADRHARDTRKLWLQVEYKGGTTR